MLSDQSLTEDESLKSMSELKLDSLYKQSLYI